MDYMGHQDPWQMLHFVFQEAKLMSQGIYIYY